MFCLDRMGSFFVGGRYVTVTGAPPREVSYVPGVPVQYDPNGTFLIEQAYVQYFLPASPRFETPLLLIHGGGLTGAQWEDTPDGRPGWLMRLLEARVAVYVIDNIERGRAGWCAVKGEWPDDPVIRSEEESTRFFRFDCPGSQFPAESIRALSAQTVPRWPSTSRLQAAAIVAAIDRIGSVILLGFSQGGGLAFEAADRRRDLVRACIAPEPNGIPTSFGPGIPNIPALMVLGDFIADHKHTSEITKRAQQGFAAWQQAGGISEVLELPKAGINGNSHMMMMDRNSDMVVDQLVAWLDEKQQRGHFR